MRTRNRLRVTGTVQGVGFRPFAYQLAQRHRISGWISNTSEGVVIEAEGEEESLQRFVRELRDEAPRLARIADVEIEPRKPEGAEGFSIRDSTAAERRLALIPADVAICGPCAAEIVDPSNRRFGYPFTNCTDCGPRFTIIRDIPYDRPNTTMAAFRMCPECGREYNDPMDRRFHAQPNACPVCGPKVWLECGTGNAECGVGTEAQDSAIQRAAEILAEGGIVAIKGLGGFHLACDARNPDAVDELRRRKGRSRKPLALMVRDVEEAHTLCRITPDEEAILLSYERPIVLLRAREDSGVAPGNRYLGLMLPYTPLHHLLFQSSPPALVMTSGNLSEEPITHGNERARQRLAHIADAFLMHDRGIHVACDDSVIRPVLGKPMLIRRARGFVPGTVDFGFEGPPILACGGEQKNTFCLTIGRWAVPSQHIGDLDNTETLDYYERAVHHLTALFQVKPEVVAYDLHPDYLATRYGRSLQAPQRVPVQHHHAHIASCMAEHRLRGPVVGVAFDGTGYGTDGAVWGGEFLVADLRSFERAAHLSYVAMPGGAAAIRRPARMALAHLLDAFGEEALELARKLLGFSDREPAALGRQIERRINSPLTSSMGRLFDAVSALLRLCSEATFEGEPAVELEMCADPEETASYGFDIGQGGGCSIVETAPVIRGIVLDVLGGAAAPTVSGRFHNTVVEIVAEVCRRIGDERGLREVVLSGGCFQNVRLLEAAIGRLQGLGFSVYWHEVVPPNDGGISLGQAAVAAAVCTENA